MDYYKRKYEGQKIVDRMYSEGYPLDEIIYKVETDIQLSAKFVTERIKKIDKRTNELRETKETETKKDFEEVKKQMDQIIKAKIKEL